jgi:hypothetical protein
MIIGEILSLITPISTHKALKGCVTFLKFRKFR